MYRIYFVLLAFSFTVFGFSYKYSTTPYVFPELFHFPKMPLAENNPVTMEGVELGRYLFYDPILSYDSTISCSSCHKQQFAFSDSPEQFSIGFSKERMQRNTMPLFNLAWYPALFWDGRAKNIEDQIFHPVRNNNEMNLQWKVAAKRLEKNKFYKPLFTKAFGKQKIDSVQISKAVSQFLRTLISYQSKYDQVLAGKSYFTKDELEGFNLINDQTKGDCLHCHTADADALGTSLVFSNNGLDLVDDPLHYKDKGRGAVTGEKTDHGKFKVPSFRNIMFTAPYMHDGRFKTIEEVMKFYSLGVKAGINTDSKMEYAHRGGVNLSNEDIEKIIAFLHTLSDSAFISNPKFGNPFLSPDNILKYTK